MTTALRRFQIGYARSLGGVDRLNCSRRLIRLTLYLVSDALFDRLHDMAAELIGRILATFNRAPTKVAASEPVKADGALVWKDLGRASVSGDHHAFEAPAATGKYRVTPIDIVGFGSGGYAVEHQPSDNPEDFKRRRRLKSSVLTPEQAKAIAQQDHDRGGDAS